MKRNGINKPRPVRHAAGFTLIEMLVVIAIIAILAGLIVGGASLAAGKGRVARVQAERDALITAIQSYTRNKWAIIRRIIPITTRSFVAVL